MNETLQKRIEEATNIMFGHQAIAAEAMKYILQHLWISVEEALPEIKEHFVSEDVLCKYSDGSIGFDYLKVNIFGQQWFEHECEESIVTHWMEIPSLEGGKK